MQVRAGAVPGRSPRTRGRRQPRRRWRAGGGSIPAHAGEAGCSLQPWFTSRVDPRARGGGWRGSLVAFFSAGRSPRTRGRRDYSASMLKRRRSIPAHAGEAQSGRLVIHRARVDPRARGGGRGKRYTTRERPGRSPRTRGRPSRPESPGRRPRSIPAHAGEACFLMSTTTPGKVDPRARGGGRPRRRF